MQALSQDTREAFAQWLSGAERPVIAALRAGNLIIEEAWSVPLRTEGRTLRDVWTLSGGGLLWTRESVVAELIRRTGTAGWEWVRSATTAWRVLHSSKGPAMGDTRASLQEVRRHRHVALYALEATRFEAILAASTARGISIDSAVIQSTATAMRDAHRQLIELFEFDPLLDTNRAQTLAWLAERGVMVDGIRSEDWGSRTVADNPLATEVERLYEEALWLRRRWTKVRELMRTTRSGKVHTKLEPLKQVSGRVSSTEPALTNVAKDMRQLLTAREGHVLVTADFDGVEVRVLAALSGDAQLVADLQSGDPYADAAERVGHRRTDYSESDFKEIRGLFKLVYIASMYGQTVGGTARALRVSLSEARRIRAALWDPFPVAKAWLEANSNREPLTLDSGRPMGVIEDPHARPNLIIQSTAYDIFQSAALRVHDHLPLGARIWLPIHDELVLETPVGSVDKAVKVLAEHMPAECRGVAITAKPVVLGAAWRKA